MHHHRTTLVLAWFLLGCCCWSVSAWQESIPPGDNDASMNDLLVYIQKHIKEGGVYTEQDEARDWLDEYNDELQEKMYQHELLYWDYMTNINDDTAAAVDESYVELAQWSSEQKEEAMKYYKYAHKNYNNIFFTDDCTVRMLDLIVHGTQPALEDPEELSEESRMMNKLEKIYASSTAPMEGADCDPECDLDQLEDILATSRDSDELFRAWKAWHDAAGPPMRPIFTQLIELKNEAAQAEGYEDMGHFWRIESYELDNLGPILDELWWRLKPMFQKLHAYVRRRLMEKYPEANITTTGPIPVHLLGNMWAQTWGNIADIVKPYPEVTDFDVSEEMEKQGYDVMRMFRTAEEFFTSIGLEPMTDTFWEKSLFEEPDDRIVQCHASAEDFYHRDDYRIKMCTKVNQDDLQTIHHEMGHVEYFMQYRNQPTVFRDGANAAFHEAIGDTIALSFATPQHLQVIGLLNLTNESPTNGDVDDQYRRKINFLMKMALEKVAFLPFALVVDRWRWNVFRDEIDETDYNNKWWEMRLKYQGVAPSEERSEDYFDPGAKYHIAAFVPYIRYFLAHVAQFQFHQALCNAKGHHEPLHACDIYQSTEAGDRLKNMLSLGRSKPWNEAMRDITQITDKFDASPICTYFEDLVEWLDIENQNEHIGWEGD